MPRVNLIGGSYSAAAQVAAAQTCLNLIPEPLPQSAGEPVQYVDLPSPGLALFAQLPAGPVRGLYSTSAGDLVAVVGSTVWHVLASGNALPIGTIASSSGPVRMSDNALVLILVDGSAAGYTATLPAAVGGAFGAVTAIVDPAFYGSLTVAVLDTYFLFVQPNGAQWYISVSNDLGSSTPGDPLYVASLTSLPQPIVAVAVAGQSIWLLGRRTSELWYDVGAADFPFQRYPGVAAGPGCAAPYSVASDSQRVFWLGQDQAGTARVYLAFQGSSTPCSTFAIDQALSSYATISDALGHIYQQAGHIFYVLTLPTAGVTWVYDATTELWHQRSSSGGRLRAQCWASAYGRVFCGDATTGTIWAVSQAYPDEGGTPILRQRSFPHAVTDGARSRHTVFGVDAQATEPVQVAVDWSDDRGATFGTPAALTLDPAANTFARLWRLGMTRDRVYRLTWSGPGVTGLLGAFIDVAPVRG